MFSKKWIVLIALVAIAAMILPACAPAPTPQVIVKEVPVEKKVVETVVVEKEVPVVKEVPKEVVKEVMVTPTPVPGAEKVTLDMFWGTEPPTFDPSLATDTTSVWGDELFFLGLTGFATDGVTTIPELATKWEASADGLVVTFHLRNDVKWVRYNPATDQVEEVKDKDGNPRMVNANDVVYGVKRTLNPNTASDYAYVLYIIKGAEAFNTADPTKLSAEEFKALEDAVGVRAVDDYTVEYTLEHAAGYFPAIAGMWVARPMPQWNIEEYGDRWTEAGLMVTNGPYALKEWAHGARLTLVKNPLWYGWAEKGAGNIEVIQGPVIMEASTGMAMYEAGELDYLGDPGWGPPLPDIDRIKADPVLNKEFKINPFLCTYYYGFVNTKPPFKDNPLLRKAFAAAIDRKSLIDNVLKGEQKPAHTFVCPGIFGNAADDMTIAPYLLDYTEGLKKAKEWIAQAGYPEGEGLDLVLMHNVSEAHARIAQAIQAMWAAAFPKAKITIETQEWKVYLKTLLPTSPDEEKPDIYRIGWCADYPDANNWLNEVFNPKSSQNYAKYDNPKFTELIEKAAVEQDPEVRKKLYNEAERIFIDEDMGIAPIYYYTRLTMDKPYMTNRPLQPGGGGDPVWLWTMDWAAKKAAKAK